MENSLRGGFIIEGYQSSNQKSIQSGIKYL